MYEEEARIKLTGAMAGAISLGSNAGQTFVTRFLGKWDRASKQLKRRSPGSFPREKTYSSDTSK